ncbi:unnamed protein product [Amoebophrya sp. A25]|nr:unnamed protein product [Amoebophrya sp. A25]|eukprot:GSA25T00006912001.1
MMLLCVLLVLSDRLRLVQAWLDAVPKSFLVVKTKRNREQSMPRKNVLTCGKIRTMWVTQMCGKTENIALADGKTVADFSQDEKRFLGNLAKDDTTTLCEAPSGVKADVRSDKCKEPAKKHCCIDPSVESLPFTEDGSLDDSPPPLQARHRVDYFVAKSADSESDSSEEKRGCKSKSCR